MSKKLKKDTISSKAGIATDKEHGSVVPPLYLSSNFAFKKFGKEQKYNYTRSANPTRDILASALTKLEGGSGGIITSSGMSAISLIASILEINDRVILPHDCYGGTFRLFSSLEKKGSLNTRFMDQSNLEELNANIQEYKPNLIWIETPSNPLLQSVDIKTICKQAKQVKALVAVDNTFLSPALQNPLKLGADIVIHSTTKYINGHSDVVGGAVIAKKKETFDKINFWANNLGLTGAPFDSYLTLRGLRTLSLRMKTHEKNAAALAQVLSNNKKVKTVYYPGLEHHSSHEIAKKQQNGFGGMLSFELKGGLPAVKKFFKKVKHFSLADSLGGFESLVCHPYTMTQAPLTDKEKEFSGITQGLIRISAGLEDIDDLISGLKKGLD
ncbi:MAG: cystathionine gamma-synthase [Pseudomonadota bacterium]|nr:cystathionine gamma-synthase [Pseudomonadota bacterium]